MTPFQTRSDGNAGLPQLVPLPAEPPFLTRMLHWLLDLVVVVNALRRWVQAWGFGADEGWEEWEVTELDCLTPTTVLVWVSKHLPHQWLLALWAWGVASILIGGVAAILVLGVFLARYARGLGRRRHGGISSSSTPALGEAEWRLAITREVQLALEGLDPSRRTPQSPRQITAGWLPPTTPRAQVSRTITPEEAASQLPRTGSAEDSRAPSRQNTARRRVRSARRASQG